MTGYVFSATYYKTAPQLRSPTALLFYVWIPVISVLEAIVSVQRPDESQLSVWIAITVTGIISLNAVPQQRLGAVL